jgi:hypothetical protein
VPDPEENRPPLTPAELRLQRLKGRWSSASGENPSNEEAGGPDPDPNPAPPSNPPEEPPVPSPTGVIDPPETTKPAAARQPKGTVAGKEKLQPYIAEDVAERARNAWYRTRSLDEGYETFSDLIEAAIREKVEQLELEHNGGEPFTPRPRKRLSSGRPVGR